MDKDLLTIDINKVDGKVISIDNQIDTSVVGEHEVIVTVEKNYVRKEVPVVVEVKDNLPPTIELKEERPNVC